MGRGGRSGVKQRSELRVRKKIIDSEDSDEDYVAEADEVDEQSDELESLAGDATEEDSEFVVEEEDEEEEEAGGDNGWRTVVKPKPKPKPRQKKRSHRIRKNGIGRPAKRRKVTRDYDDDSDDDDDDEEFTPDEVDFLEEEEEEEEEGEEEEEEEEEEEDDDDDDDDDDDEKEEDRPVKAKTKKRGRTTLKRKKSVKGRKRRRGAKTIKKLSKRKTRASSLSKTESGDDEDFNEKGPTLRNRIKRKPGTRKKRLTTGSDSDICSDSSDCDFTISEEEREQIREANNICRTLATNLRSSRKIQEDEVLCEQRKPPPRKGKEKVQETKNNVGKPVCGICLTEEAKTTVRGTLNCCSHFFCFACIMEWSKVETRCPLCKQRFVTITKPTRCSKGFDLRNAVVAVPERDQVYQPSEEELRDFLNPYENVICTECHHGGDDALMLLCDLCDSPAHTYCVGLGREVPEGNWYCDGCRPAALASLQSQTQDYMPDQRIGTLASGEQSRYENMAEIDLNVTIPETPISQGDSFQPSPRFTGGNFQAPSPVNGIGVSTVSGRRMIHRQIRFMLSSRRNQNGADMNSLGNLIGRQVNAPSHQSRTHVGTSHAQQVGRYQEFDPHSVQNTDFVSGMTGTMMEQIGQPSTAADSSAYGDLSWSGLDRINLEAGVTHVPASDQLHSCPSASSMGHDVGIFPSLHRDAELIGFVKPEIHSAVRDQLKSLSRNMSLDHNTCVEISRRSVHTIMAAYGLEPRRHDTFEAHPTICVHRDNRLPNPMNDCCLVCFQDFVKDVVKRNMDILVPPVWLGFR